MLRTPAAVTWQPRRVPQFRAGFVCAAFLAVLSALVMVRLADSLEPYAVASGGGDDTRTIAQNFYDAANQVLLTGTSPLLSQYVAADAQFTDGIGDSWLNVDNLVVRLSEIGDGNPGVRLGVTSLTVDGTEAVAMVRLSEPEDRLSAAVGVDGTGSWIDRLTIHDGVVTGLSGGTASLRSSTLILDDSLRHSGSLANVGLVTLIIEQGAVIPVTAPGALSVVVENGTVRLDFEVGSSPAAVHSRDTFYAGTMPGQSMVLRPGDRFSLLGGAEFSLRTESSLRASMGLVALLNPIPGDAGTASKEQHGRFSGFLVNGATGATWEGSPGGWASMDSRQEFETYPGAKRLRIEQIDLMPGSSLVPVLTATAARQFVLFAKEGAVVVAPPPGTPPTGAQPVILNRQHAMSLKGAPVTVCQVGEAPARLIVVRLEHLGSA